MGHKLRLACPVCTERLSAVRHQLHSWWFARPASAGPLSVAGAFVFMSRSAGEKLCTIGRTQLSSVEPT